MADRYVQLCWDCHTPLGDNAVKVPVHGRLQPMIGGSDTYVCPACARQRGVGDG